jgi:hypothetical protein
MFEHSFDSIAARPPAMHPQGPASQADSRRRMSSVALVLSVMTLFAALSPIIAVAKPLDYLPHFKTVFIDGNPDSNEVVTVMMQGGNQPSRTDARFPSKRLVAEDITVSGTFFAEMSKGYIVDIDIGHTMVAGEHGLNVFDAREQTGEDPPKPAVPEATERGSFSYSVNTADLPPGIREGILDACTSSGEVRFDFPVAMQVKAFRFKRGNTSINKRRDNTVFGKMPVSVICQVETEVKAPPKISEAALGIAISGQTCPKPATVEVMIAAEAPREVRYKIERGNGTTTTPGWIEGKIKMQKGLMGAKSAFLRAEHELDALDPGKRKFRLWIDGWGKTPWRTVDVECPPFKVTSLWLTYDVEDKDPCPKKVVEKVTGKATRPGTAPFEIKTQGGLVVHSGTATFKREGISYVTEFGRNNLGFSNAFESDMMALITTQPDANSGWVKLKVECLYKPSDAGASTDLAPETRPEDPPPVHPTLTGDFSFLDNGGTRCPRQGKALINLKTSKPDNVHWSLDCTNGHFSGMAQTAPSPQGGYVAPALASFAVNQTTHAKCALKTVAPGKAKVHRLKGHLFQCVGRTDVGGPEDLTPETPSDPQKPGTAVVDPVKPDEPKDDEKPDKVTDTETQQISCANGVIRNGGCDCEPHFRPVKAGKNAWRCVRSTVDPKPEKPIVSEPKISCARGKVVNGACKCASTDKLVKSGKNAWACVKVVVDPPRSKDKFEAKSDKAKGVKTAPKKTMAPKLGKSEKAKADKGKAKGKTAKKGNGSSAIR